MHVLPYKYTTETKPQTKEADYFADLLILSLLSHVLIYLVHLIINVHKDRKGNT